MDGLCLVVVALYFVHATKSLLDLSLEGCVSRGLRSLVSLKHFNILCEKVF